MSRFRLAGEFKPRGDQPKAIAQLSEGIDRGRRFQTLLGVTGSGKTFTMANVTARTSRPALVIAHNKTLAAQLYGEFRDLFPDNAVHFFVSYYDYYQPEAYLPASDTYIEKETLINDDIERMRHGATHALRTRGDVIVVASVSCIYGLGTARAYVRLAVTVNLQEEYGREKLLRKLVDSHYLRSDTDFYQGTFRVRGDTVEVFPPYEEARAVRIEFFEDTVEGISEFDPLRGGGVRALEKITLYPASHYLSEVDERGGVLAAIERELESRVAGLRAAGKRLEANRLEQRTLRDMELLEQFGTCPGIENYSRHLSGRLPGEPPPCLLDYFPEDFLIFIDESHQTVPQIGAMYRGDRSRKETLVDYGFRLPSALDNRPLRFDEFETMIRQVVFVSATPAGYELKKSKGAVIEQIIRPTGLLDPEVEVRPGDSQVDDLLAEIRTRAACSERVLVTCLTKRMAEDLSDYFLELGVRCRYLHSDIDTLERVRIVRDLRLGLFDVLVGINLLREGLDIPEVSLVAILDADKEGFLRSEVSLMQTIGRAARHLHGKAILYANSETASIRKAVEETERRRLVQARYNAEHHITPEQVRRNIVDLAAELFDAAPHAKPLPAEAKGELLDQAELRRRMAECEAKMREAARKLEFELAARYRDRLLLLREMDMGLKPASPALLEAVGVPEKPHPRRGARRFHRRQR